MWFKNLKLYRITQALDITEQEVETKLADFPFRTSTSQELESMGWHAPIAKSERLIHSANNKLWLCLKKQEKLLPASVINAELADKVAQIEAETGSSVGKKAQTDLKQDIIHKLLPRAFSKDSFIHGFVSFEHSLVAVDASSDAKAELFLAMLRKALGSLPLLPWGQTSVAPVMTAWLKGEDVPADITLMEEAELSGVDEEDGIVRFKKQDLSADEIAVHLEAGKIAQKLAVEWDETFTAVLQADLAIKRLKFTDVVREQNDDIPKDQMLAKLDADFALMSSEVVRFAQRLTEIFELQD